MKEHIREIHERAVKNAKSYLSAEAELIEDLMRMHQEHGYREFKVANLKEYAMSCLGLSEYPAETLGRIARKCGQVPELLAGIRSGEISITNAKIVCSILTVENQEEWLHAARHLSKRDLEALIVEQNPERAIKEKLQQVNAEIWEFRTGLTHDRKEKLRRVQDLESTRLKKAATLAESLDAGTECYLERHDPIRKAKRAWQRKLRRALAVQGEKVAVQNEKVAVRPPRGGSPRRKKLNADVRHEMAMKDEDRCSFIREDGKRCDARRWLHIHHKLPLAQGGLDTPENLQILCGQHHALVHHHPEQGRLNATPR